MNRRCTIVYRTIGVLFCLEVSLYAQALPAQLICKKDQAPMVLVPGGNFVYGISKKVRDSLLVTLKNAKLPLFELEFDLQTKNIPSYYIDKVEVTNRQYRLFMKETGHRSPNYWSDPAFNAPDQPVVGVGYADANAYAKWAGKRLPSEEEWEKAARGTTGRIWPWGNKPSGSVYNGSTQGINKPVAVGSFPAGASPYGVLDMAGNVYEMTTGLWTDTSHAIRGGSFLNTGAYTRTMFRWAADDEIKGAVWLGFRCVADTNIATEH